MGKYTYNNYAVKNVWPSNYRATYGILEVSSNPIEIERTLVTIDSNHLYNGKTHKPSITVKYKNKTLTEGIDYEIISYVKEGENQIEAGTKHITIRGINRFTGIDEMEWIIASTKNDLIGICKECHELIHHENKSCRKDMMFDEDGNIIKRG